MASAPITMTTCSSTLRPIAVRATAARAPAVRAVSLRGGVARSVVSALVHPPALAADLHDGDREDHDEEHPGEGGCLAGLAVPEGEVVDLLHDHLRCAARSSPGHRVHLVEDLEPVDERDHD